MHLTLIFSVLLLVFPVHHLFSAYLTIIFLFTLLVGFWGYCSIAFFQQVASLANNIAIQIAAGSSLKVRQSQNANTSNIFVSFSF